MDTRRVALKGEQASPSITVGIGHRPIAHGDLLHLCFLTDALHQCQQLRRLISGCIALRFTTRFRRERTQLEAPRVADVIPHRRLIATHIHPHLIRQNPQGAHGNDHFRENPTVRTALRP